PSCPELRPSESVFGVGFVVASPSPTGHLANLGSRRGRVRGREGAVSLRRRVFLRAGAEEDSGVLAAGPLRALQARINGSRGRGLPEPTGAAGPGARSGPGRAAPAAW